MAAESAQLISTNTIKWSGGRNFDGWVLLLMAMPKVDGVAWTRISLKDKRPKLRVPTRVRVPIRDGVYDATTEIWQTTSLVPPQVKYAAFFYDDNNVLIATKSALFVVETDPYTLDPPSLPDPTAETNVPTPQAVPGSVDGTVTVTAGGTPTREDVSGTKNGVNTAFTISSSGTVVLLIWNQTVLDEDVHYTISGTNITMQAPYLPDAGDTFEALIWS